MADNHRLQKISAALDGEATIPADLTDDEVAFVDGARRVRAGLRLEHAATPPDVVDAVLDELRLRSSPRGRRPPLLVAAAVFVVAMAVGSFATPPGGPAAPGVAFAEVAERLLEAQSTVLSLDAHVVIVERGVHPDVPVRRLEGTLRYRAPERLWLHLEQRSATPAGWPRNDLDLVVDEGIAWERGLGSCPVGAQPTCLDASERVVGDPPPFASEWAAPLDLVVPAGAFLPVTTTEATESGDRVVVATTVARVDRLVEGLRSAGAIRDVHPTDLVRLELDRETLTFRRLSVVASGNVARVVWAATNGYRDDPGAEVLSVEVDATGLPTAGFPRPPDVSKVSAGFVARALPPLGSPPPGFVLHRTGVLQDGGPRTKVYAYSDGHAWIRIDVTDEWDEPRLFGSLGPLVRPVPVGTGIGYTDPAGTRLAVHTPGLDVVVTGSVDLDVLADAASAITTGVPLDPRWEQARQVSDIPAGALVPSQAHLAALVDGELIIAVGGPGRTGFELIQRPATVLAPPLRADIIETRSRGLRARYEPRLGTLTWLEGGWMRELRADDLDLAALQDIADALIEP